MSERRGLLPIVVALVVIVLWGGTPVVTKLATLELDPLIVGVMRTVFGGLIAAPLALALRIKPPREKGKLLPLLLSAFCGFVGFPIVFTVGQQMTSAMHGGLILAVLPILTGLYVALLERQRPSRRWWLGCAIALIGEAVLIGGRDLASGPPASLIGDLLVFASALIAAAGYVAGAKLSQRGYRSLGTTLWGIAFGAIAVAPSLFWLTPAGLPAASPTAWGAVLFIALITSILGYIGWYWALGAGGIARIGTLQFLQPISGVALAFAFLAERPNWVLLLATAMILIGVVIAQRR